MSEEKVVAKKPENLLFSDRIGALSISVWKRGVHKNIALDASYRPKGSSEWKHQKLYFNQEQIPGLIDLLQKAAKA